MTSQMFAEKRAVVAMQVTATNAIQVAQWCGGKYGYNYAPKKKLGQPSKSVKQPRIEIINELGHTKAYLGDYVIRNDDGLFYACDSEVFHILYTQSDKVM